MPSGGRRTGSGRKPLPAAVHLLRGTWRPSRHGKRPPTVGALALPVPTGSWAPDPEVLASLGLAGRTVIAAVLARYELTLIEGLVLVEVAHAADALSSIRAAPHADVVAQRLALQHSKHFSSLLIQLRLEATP